jgi:hypothetical protein
MAMHGEGWIHACTCMHHDDDGMVSFPRSRGFLKDLNTKKPGFPSSKRKNAAILEKATRTCEFPLRLRPACESNDACGAMYVYVCMHACMRVRVCMHVCVHACVHACLHGCHAC